MTGFPDRSRIRQIAVVVAGVFGMLTILAGMRVLLGGDPGYTAYRPLLLFNTGMGGVYLLTAVLIWKSVTAGRKAAGVIALLNLAVLLAIIAYRAGGGAVASESVSAMTLRTAVWAAIYTAVWWSTHGVDSPHAPHLPGRASTPPNSPAIFGSVLHGNPR